MKQPPSFQSDPIPGPDFDPMDAIIQNLLNVEVFMSYLSEHPKDFDYLKTHLTGILGLRRTLALEIEKLSEEPYNYLPARLQKLQEDNERLFVYLEGAVGEMKSEKKDKFKNCVKAVEEILSKFDNELTP